MRAAEKVFAEKGFTKAKISEIAKIAGISEASVYEYFENKEDVFLSIPRHRFQENLYELSETFHIKNPIRKLKRFTKYYFFLMLTEEDFLKVFLFQLQLNPRFYRSKAFESFQRYFRVVEEIIEEGKKKAASARCGPACSEHVFISPSGPPMMFRWQGSRQDPGDQPRKNFSPHTIRTRPRHRLFKTTGLLVARIMKGANNESKTYRN